MKAVHIPGGTTFLQEDNKEPTSTIDRIMDRFVYCFMKYVSIGQGLHDIQYWRPEKGHFIEIMYVSRCGKLNQLISCISIPAIEYTEGKVVE